MRFDPQNHDELTRRIEALHALGLDARYDDVLGIEDIDNASLDSIIEKDRAAFLAAGPAYDYRRQCWAEMHDHAHMSSGHGELPLLFCGSDRTTCVGLPAVAEVTVA